MRITEIRKGKILTIKDGLASGQTCQIKEFKRDVIGIVKGKYFIDLMTYNAYPIAFSKSNLKPYSYYVGELAFFLPQNKEEKIFLEKEVNKLNEWYQKENQSEHRIINFDSAKQKILRKNKGKY